MSMSASDPASAGPETATTPSGTTPASALWITCRSTGATTAWVGHAAAASSVPQCQVWAGRPFSLPGRHEEELLLQELLLRQQDV